MDALDVIHVFFEEDLLSGSSREEIEARSKGRAILYREFYKKTYRHGVSSSNESYNYSTASDGLIGDTDDVGDPLKTPTKPYTPSTDFDPNSPLPFGNTLDAPIG